MNWLKRWLKKHFTYSYTTTFRTVVPGQKIQTAIDGVVKGKGYQMSKRGFRFPWKAAPVDRGRIYLCPGVWRETFTMRSYVDLVGSGNEVTIIKSQ